MKTAILAVAVSLAESTPQHGAAKEASSGGLPQFDPSSFPSQIFWLAVTFGILYAFMANIILPKIGGVIEGRKDRIADDLDKAAEFKRQAEEAEAAYKQGLADARAKAQGIAAETRAGIDEEIAAMQADAEEKAAESVRVAEARISEMKTQAKVKVREAATETTRSIVEATN